MKRQVDVKHYPRSTECQLGAFRHCDAMVISGRCLDFFMVIYHDIVMETQRSKTVQVRLDAALMEQLKSLNLPAYVGKSHEDRAEYAIAEFIRTVHPAAGLVEVRPDGQ